MKKKLLSILLALAVGFTFSFAFAGAASAAKTDNSKVTWDDSYSSCIYTNGGDSEYEALNVAKTMDETGLITACACFNIDSEYKYATVRYYDLGNATIKDASWASADKYVTFQDSISENPERASLEELADTLVENDSSTITFKKPTDAVWYDGSTVTTSSGVTYGWLSTQGCTQAEFATEMGDQSKITVPLSYFSSENMKNKYIASDKYASKVVTYKVWTDYNTTATASCFDGTVDSNDEFLTYTSEESPSSYIKVTPSAEYEAYNDAAIDYTLSASEYLEDYNASLEDFYAVIKKTYYADQYPETQYAIRETTSGKVNVTVSYDEDAFQSLKLKLDGFKEDTYLEYSDGCFSCSCEYDGIEHQLSCESANVEVKYAEYKKDVRQVSENSDRTYYREIVDESTYTTDAPSFKNVSKTNFTYTETSSNGIGGYMYHIVVTPKTPTATIQRFTESLPSYEFDIKVEVTKNGTATCKFDSSDYFIASKDELEMEDVLKVSALSDADTEKLKSIADKYITIRDETGSEDWFPAKVGKSTTIGMYVDKSLLEDEDAMAFLGSYDYFNSMYSIPVNGVYTSLKGIELSSLQSSIEDGTPVSTATVTRIATEKKENNIKFNTTAAYKTYKAAKKGKYKNKLSANKTIKSKATADYGTISYELKQGGSKIVIDENTGTVTVKKGLKKGTHKVTVVATVAASDEYTAAKETHKITIKVK